MEKLAIISISSTIILGIIVFIDLVFLIPKVHRLMIAGSTSFWVQNYHLLAIFFYLAFGLGIYIIYRFI
jgi:hypothetical protein